MVITFPVKTRARTYARIILGRLRHRLVVILSMSYMTGRINKNEVNRGKNKVEHIYHNLLICLVIRNCVNIEPCFTVDIFDNKSL